MKTKLLVTLAAAAFVLAGCSNDENEVDNWNGEIRLASGVTVQTRAANTPPDTQIAGSQEVGIFINDAKTDNAVSENLEYTADGSGGLTLAVKSPVQPVPYYPATGNAVNIIAYHPRNNQASLTDNSGYAFSVVADQSQKNENYYNSDLLYSSKTEYPRQPAAHNLSFVHKLSKVICNLASGNGKPAIAGATVKIVDAELKGTFVPSTGDFTTEPGNKSDVTMNSAITPNTYIAIIPPQTYTKGSKFLEVTLLSGDVFYYTIPNKSNDQDLVMNKGNVYTYNITVDMTELKVVSSISEWEGIETNKKSGSATMDGLTASYNYSNN